MISRPVLEYGRQLIEEDDVAAVVDVLRGDWLTTGPAVQEFENTLAAFVGAKHAVVCNSGTAALYLAYRSCGLKPGDVVVVPAITFLATASAAILAELEVVFADVDPDTGIMGPEHMDRAIRRAARNRVRVVAPVHMAGRVGDPAALKSVATDLDLIVIEDACHALGTRYGNAAHRVGDCAHSAASCFSFHPVKTIAMGEGGAVTTNSEEIAEKCRVLRNHGMVRRADGVRNPALGLSADGAANPWYYEVDEISHNFRASDINCALGLSQLRKAGRYIAARRTLMAHYQTRLAELSPIVTLVPAAADVEPAWHLCTLLIDFARTKLDRRATMVRLRERGIGTQVHYIPVHMQPFYRARYGDVDLPGAMEYYRRTLSLPLFPSMTEADVDRVVDALADIFRA
jgi:UDP-4-amino-4,6-dideoxy-N-acetyl-beta-L-altrosamine transaminase